MRRIFIDLRVISVANAYMEAVKSKGFVENLKSLCKELETQPDADRYLKYVENIVSNYDKIIVAKPDEFDKYNLFPELDMDKKFYRKFKKESKSGEKKEMKFYELVVEAMGYEHVRNHIYPTYISSLGIRSCVYCNSQYGVTLKHKGNGMTSSYEIDHFRPKSKFPLLATSFFNLQMSCSHCNRLKHKEDADFNLFTSKASELEPFRFFIEETSRVLFCLSGDSADLNVGYKAASSLHQQLFDNHEKIFHVNAKYSNFKDEAAELVAMSRFYNPAYLKQLEAQFGSLAPQFRGILKNAILGFSKDPSSAHQRPLTIMRQDIARQLEII